MRWYINGLAFELYLFVPITVTFLCIMIYFSKCLKSAVLIIPILYMGLDSKLYYIWVREVLQFLVSIFPYTF